MSVSGKHGDGAMPPGRAPRRFLLRQRTWGVLTAAAVLAIGITIPAASFAASSTPMRRRPVTRPSSRTGMRSPWLPCLVTRPSGRRRTSCTWGSSMRPSTTPCRHRRPLRALPVPCPGARRRLGPGGRGGGGPEILVTYVPSARPPGRRLAASLAHFPTARRRPAASRSAPRRWQPDPAARPRGSQRAHYFEQPPARPYWRPIPRRCAMYDPWLGFVTPMLVRSATQFGPGPPPPLTSARYTHDFAETKELGSLNSTARTPAQTSTALFFSGNAMVQFNTELLGQVTTHLDIVGAARMSPRSTWPRRTPSSRCGARSTSTVSGGRSRRSTWPTPTATQPPAPTPAGCR